MGLKEMTHAGTLQAASTRAAESNVPPEVREPYPKRKDTEARYAVPLS
jgi:hypothetical protein